ncbi:MAG: hypothetical protein ABJO67_10315 [Pseudoruegeria sp.]
MALPLAPIAGIALRYGTVALATYAVSRSLSKGRRDQRAEDVMDEIDEGMTLRRDEEQVNGTARLRRVIRIGSDGPGVEVDLTTFGRIKFKKV